MQSVLKSAQIDPPPYVIVDLQFNGGGDYTTSYRGMRGLPGALPKGTPIYILTSNATFSAGITSVVFLKQAAAAGEKEIGVMMSMRAKWMTVLFQS
ncbi:hypothetical protein [Pseudovibrio axinellae]|uniref:hypothetical protein n=1 Tax=Pseudovibrio axinellae TaxID=989403 RepID=UPI001113F7A5|nr:hypothetical protein [Pseudovibrio axinellae]